MASGNEMPKPIAQGDLARTPFAHLLLYVRRHSLSGTLVIWDPSGGDRPTQDRIRFQDGVPIAARLTHPSSRLDRGLLQLFPRAAGPYAFYGDIDLVGDSENVRTGRVDVLPLIAASLRGSSREDAVDHILNSLGDSLLRFSAGVDIESLGLLQEETTILDLLRAEPASVERLVELSALKPRMVRRLIYFFMITKSVEPWKPDPASQERSARVARARVEASNPHIRLSDSGSFSADATDSGSFSTRTSLLPPPPISEPEEEMPEGLSEEHQARWQEIVERIGSIDTETFFEMLGVDKKTNAKDVQSAYYGLVKKWHPDRLPRELIRLRPQVEEIFRFLTRAQDVLTNDEERVKYIAAVESGGGTPESDRQVGAIISAAMEFRKVEIMMRRQEWDAALELIDAILEVADDEGDYHGARGWILFCKAKGAPSAEIEVIESLDKALELNKDSDKLHYYKGMVLKKQGNMTEAVKHFKRAAKLNKRNIEAAREVRLANLRGGGDSLFGKLFGSSNKK